MGTFLSLTIIKKLVVFFCLIVCSLGNYPQTIGPKGLEYSQFDRSYLGDVMTKFGEDRFVS